VNERQPIFNAPGIVLGVLAAMVAVFVAVDPAWGLLPDVTRAWLFAVLALVPDRLSDGAGMLPGAIPGGRLAAATQLVTHIFVHANLTHLVMNGAFILAIGTPVARRLGAVRFIAFFLLCGIGGAVLHLLSSSDPAVGASGAVSGLLGAVLRFLRAPSSGDADRQGQPPAEVGRGALLSLRDTLTDRRILIGIGAWVVLNIVAARALPSLLDVDGIAWQAHLGGFFTGLLTFGLFDPPPPR
jgi:membrane associated rhomboid family serine protease